MAIQRLYCKPGKHDWQRQSQRGKPPLSCPTHKGANKRTVTATVIETDSIEEIRESESTSTVLSGVALADRLMADLASRGQLLSQQKSNTYSGPRY